MEHNTSTSKHNFPYILIFLIFWHFSLCWLVQASPRIKCFLGERVLQFELFFQIVSEIQIQIRTEGSAYSLLLQASVLPNKPIFPLRGQFGRQQKSVQATIQMDRYVASGVEALTHSHTPTSTSTSTITLARNATSKPNMSSVPW